MQTSEFLTKTLHFCVFFLSYLGKRNQEQVRLMSVWIFILHYWAFAAYFIFKSYYLLVQFYLFSLFSLFTCSFPYIALLKTDLTNRFYVTFSYKFRTFLRIWLQLIAPFWRFCLHSDIPTIRCRQILDQTAVDTVVLRALLNPTIPKIRRIFWIRLMWKLCLLSFHYWMSGFTDTLYLNVDLPSIASLWF